ncbi:(Fe-S)-binding protein [Desulfobacula toluolica]|uniref:Putative oxidoreductase n=1 Tax=Desulfobacula toluolica (strain DSM 7467 / Tol2) TaxID=651182 RepID=K0NE92_DESTT|nr:(Fe-S)-binding protein [Desulfobacula toluolica]CCK79321.1 putative oxidoreductase [Desulfobacula toluolica Tol2]
MQLSKQQIDYCMECGVCTGSCPVAMELDGFSPRQMIKRTLGEPEGDILQSKDIWACLSCSRCSDRCPVEIDFPAFIRTYRNKARQEDNLPKLSHHGMFHTITSIQATGVQQDRIGWAKEAGKIAEKGDYFYFTGCVAFYDIAFQYLDLHMIESAKNNLMLLNKMGIEPVISNDECCCGHDAFWSGDDDTFLTLAKKNIETIVATGAKTVIFGCPEGYSMFREAYTQQLGPLPFEIIHITEFLAKELPNSDVCFKNGSSAKVTFQDPCRLGRRSGIYDAPRDLISLVPGSELAEMEHNRENAVCCGTTAWMECSTCSKVMQMQRLKEAEAVGAQVMITACPKCQIHLTCAKKNTDHNIDIIDLVSYLVANIE